MDVALIIIGVLVVAAIAIGLSIKSLIVICQPSEVVIFSGPNKLPGQRVGFRSVRGGRGLRIPLLEKVDRLDLTNMSVEVSVRGAYSRDGVPINVQGVANLKIDGDSPGLDNAVERLLGKSTGEIERLARETLEGNLRGVLARLTPEQVNEDKESFAAELIEEAEVDLGRLGLTLDTLKIQTVADEVGYLDSIGRAKTADLIRRARIAEAERNSEAAIQQADNQRRKRIAQVGAGIEMARADASKRVVKATSERPALVAREEATIAAQIARAEAEVRVQTARIEQIKVQLEADLIMPARAYKAQREAEAKAAVAEIREQGRATAEGLTALAKTWLAAGDDAREIFMLEKLRTLVAIMTGTVKNVQVDSITMVAPDAGGNSSSAAKAASLIEQLKAAADIDVPDLLKGFGIGSKATSARTQRTPPAVPHVPTSTASKRLERRDS